jgi:hypothetical protein
LQNLEMVERSEATLGIQVSDTTGVRERNEFAFPNVNCEIGSCSITAVIASTLFRDCRDQGAFVYCIHRRSILRARR